MSNRKSVLVFKMANTRRHHCNAMFITIFECQFILYRSTRLNNGCYSLVTCNFHTVGEREESIRSHHSPIQIESECFRFLYYCFKASTREVCPTPLASNCLFLASTIAFDLLFFTILLANNISSTSSGVGALSVTAFKSATVSIFKSLSVPTHRSIMNGIAFSAT